MNYRPEIDGLRALAVIPVIFFHAGFEAFQGGYVGVDIFFVISGYLITSILIRELEQQRFNLLSFYERRARRILPALIFVILCCIPVAWLTLLPGQFEDFSKSVAATSLFSSNFFFWQESDYFDTAAELKPLLHTWSLAVEEQFYLVFPLLLVFLWNRDRRKVTTVLTALVLLSLLLSEISWRFWQSANFYFPHTRAWELLAGSLAAFYVTRHGVKTNNPASLVGLILIVGSCHLFDELVPAPSVYTAIPVIGAVLLILYCHSDTLVGRVLSSRVAVGVGLISYSAYLWHQPLFAFTRVARLDPPGVVLYLSLILLTFSLAAFSWRFIEQPFRTKTPLLSRNKVFGVSFCFFMSFLLFGAFGTATNGFSDYRFSETERKILSHSDNQSDRRELLGDHGNAVSWMLIGDSHANSLQEALHLRFQQTQSSALVHTIDGCPPALELWRHDKFYGSQCQDHYTKALQLIKDKPIKNVLVLARYALYLESTRFDNGAGGVEVGRTREVIYDHIDFKSRLRSHASRSKAIQQQLTSYISNLSQAGVNVFVLSGIPEVGWDVPRYSYRKFKNGDSSEVTTSRAVFDKRNASTIRWLEAVAGLDNVTVVDITESMCDSKQCYATENNTPLYFDTNHPNRLGADKIVEVVFNVLRDSAGL